MQTQTKLAAKERPILFSGPMIRAILEGKKTQTVICDIIRVCHTKTRRLRKPIKQNVTKNAVRNLSKLKKLGITETKKRLESGGLNSHIGIERSTLRERENDMPTYGNQLSPITVGAALVAAKQNSCFWKSTISTTTVIYTGSKLALPQKPFLDGLREIATLIHSKSFVQTAIKERSVEVEYAPTN